MRAALALALAVLVLAPATARAETVVLRGATVLPQDSPPIADADLVIEGTKVLAVGPRGKVAVPQGARVIDAAGQFVVPGLLDLHAHVSDERVFMDLYLAHGVTAIRDMGNRLEYSVALRKSVESGERAGPEVVYVGPILDGNPPVWPGISEVLESPDQVAPLLSRLKESGVTAAKVYEGLSLPVYDAIVREARKLGLPVIGHVPKAIGLAHCIESGQDTIEHLDHVAPTIASRPDASPDDITREITDWALADDAKERALIESLVAHKTRLDPTRVVMRAFSQVLRGITPDEPLARLLPVGITKGFWGMFAGRPRADATKDRRHESALARSLEFVKRAHAAGVPILAGSDTPNPWVVPGVSLVEEVEELAQALGPEEALRSATLRNAQALRREDLGRIAAGTRADLVVLAKDPRTDARALRSPLAVFARGRRFDRAGLAKLLSDLEGVASQPEQEPAAPGFDAIAGELATPGDEARGAEVRLEGAVKGLPPSFWMRAACFEQEGGGTRRVLRSSGTFPLPYRDEESLELSASGKVQRYHVALERMGERREATLARVEGGGFRLAFALAGKTTSEVAVGEGETLECTGGLLLYDALARLELAEGGEKVVPVRRIDLEKLALGPAKPTHVRRLAGREGERRFEVKTEGEDVGIGALRFRLGADATPLGFSFDTGIGKFEAKPPATPAAPTPGSPPKPVKKYY